MFLNGIPAGSRYHCLAMSLKSQLRSVKDIAQDHGEYTTLLLPRDWTIHPLALQLHSGSGKVTDDMSMNRRGARAIRFATEDTRANPVGDIMHQRDFDRSLSQGESATVSELSLLGLSTPTVNTATTCGVIMQGCDEAIVSRIERRGGGRPPLRPLPRPERSARREDAKRVKYDGICNACGKYGHPATRCNQLAMNSYMEKYLKNRPYEEIRQAEEHWVERNKKWLVPGQTPRAVAAKFFARTGLDDDAMAEQMDWDHFEPGPDDPEGFDDSM